MRGSLSPPPEHKVLLEQREELRKLFKASEERAALEIEYLLRDMSPVHIGLKKRSESEAPNQMNQSSHLPPRSAQSLNPTPASGRGVRPQTLRSNRSTSLESQSFPSMCIHCYKINTTTKGLPLLTKRGMPPFSIVFFPQVKKMMHTMHQYQVPLQRYMAMMDLQVDLDLGNYERFQKKRILLISKILKQFSKIHSGGEIIHCHV
ncbi:unnamed protein product [Fraxinus pennsylvanica]|uniref:Uncharacterized protein n=1 Tax=Fraxinus pennsylvanica TaxID=56036 RepID=A0AAD2ADA9_9LAMI|nr:unnamed protein product [Fraxinus pennsylvanica]